MQIESIMCSHDYITPTSVVEMKETDNTKCWLEWNLIQLLCEMFHSIHQTSACSVTQQFYLWEYTQQECIEGSPKDILACLQQHYL